MTEKKLVWPENMPTLHFQFSGVKRLPVLYYSVDFLPCPFQAWILPWNFETIRWALIWPTDFN